MKEFAKKQQRRLHVVAGMLSADGGSAFTRNLLDRSFQDWLGSIEATEELNMSARAVTTFREDFEGTGVVRNRKLRLCPPADGLVPQASAATLFPTRLTTQDYVQVMLATVREGRDHPRWPREVVEHFLAAEVISGT